MTFYDPQGGYGACGWGIAQDSPEVALAASMMGDKVKCGQMINIKGPAGTFQAKVADKCVACEDDYKLGLNRIDVPRQFAAKVSGWAWKGDEDFKNSPTYEHGSLEPITWEWA